MRRILFLIILLVMAGCTERVPMTFRNTDITGAKFGHSLNNLRDHHEKPVDLSDFHGKAVLLFFGYTSCPDICPTALARFAEVMKVIGKDANRVQVLFVTLDPERDTPERLSGYVPWFYPSFIGLYGDLATTKAVAQEFKVYYARSKGSEGMGYMIDHSTGAYVFDPAGNIRLYLKDDAPVEAIASDLKRLLAGD
jgi:protein SCO1/2